MIRLRDVTDLLIYAFNFTRARRVIKSFGGLTVTGYAAVAYRHRIVNNINIACVNVISMHFCTNFHAFKNFKLNYFM